MESARHRQTEPRQARAVFTRFSLEASVGEMGGRYRFMPGLESARVLFDRP